ncbi:MAG: hypothetical protein ABFE08_22260 [Armatimonadia bacterium]
MKQLLSLSLLGMLALCGCKAGGPTATQAPPVKILAYINVSSGCQQETVDLLKSLPAKDPRVQVEFVDFGDGGAGAQRWQDSGHKCMTIEINGSPNVKFKQGETTKVMSFRMPAGYIWTHPDLEAAVQAALEGNLQPATEDEVVAAMGGEMPETPKPKQPIAAPKK